MREMRSSSCVTIRSAEARSPEKSSTIPQITEQAVNAVHSQAGDFGECDDFFRRCVVHTRRDKKRKCGAAPKNPTTNKFQIRRSL